MPVQRQHKGEMYGCDEKVKIDTALIAEVIASLVEKRDPRLPGKRVCDSWPTRREGKGEVTEVKQAVTSLIKGGNGRQGL